MTSYKKISLGFIFFSFSLILFADTQFVDKKLPTEVTFLHFNDFYKIEAHYGKGGLLLLSQTLEQQKRLHPNVITTFGGDLLSPSLYSSVSKGKHMVDALNLLNIDIAVPGNHEFDFGLNNASTQFSQSKFPWIINNLKQSDTKLVDFTISTYIHKVNNLKIGFLGLITPKLAFLSADKSQVNVSDYIETAKQAVLLLKKQGVDLIVALTHLTLKEDKQLAQSVTGINLILGGHDHYPLSLLVNNTLILKAGSNAEYLGVVNISIDQSKANNPVDYSWQFISTAIKSDKRKNSHTIQSKAVSSYLEYYALQLNKQQYKYLATTLIPLDARSQTVRAKESNFANLLADALQHHYQTDIAMINGGAIRSNKIYAAKSALNTKDILTALPFSNKAVVVKLSGKQLLEILQHGVGQVEKYSGRFPQIAGFEFEFEFSPLLTTDQQISNVKINHQPVNPEKIYTMATIDYLFQGGDGYETFKQTRAVVDIEQGELFSNIVINYLSNLKQIKAVDTGRIKVVYNNN